MRPPMPRLLRTCCSHSFLSSGVVPSRNQTPPTTAPSAMPMETQRSTALVPSLTQLERISEPRIASDQTRGVCLLWTIAFHALDLVLGLHLGLRDRAVLARGSQGTEDVSGLEHRFA